MALTGQGPTVAVDVMLQGMAMALDRLLTKGMANSHIFRPSLKCGWAVWTVMISWNLGLLLPMLLTMTRPRPLNDCVVWFAPIHVKPQRPVKAGHVHVVV